MKPQSITSTTNPKLKPKKPPIAIYLQGGKNRFV
ncbi:uncharacterized protein G2W53_016582 [Senna tora]|uniref:Uncharacterized protein n=1 Tax=Senna tora TaxID=362788 RepID=A0A834TMZ0_9FABA|nr:uncharacterized protein G2W53_016582 [Senna tora]